MGLDRKVKGDGVDPQSMNQLPVDKTPIGPGIQEDREWDGLMFPPEDRLQEGAGYRGITGAACQDPSGYWQARSFPEREGHPERRLADSPQ